MVKFYKCNTCGNIIYKLVDKNIPVFCCGKPMAELNANSVDAAVEKHVPEFSFDGDKLDVVVGGVLHPATVEHHIDFILVETKDGILVKHLDPVEEPRATFYVKKEDVKTVYAYCNLHGLWKKDI